MAPLGELQRTEADCASCLVLESLQVQQHSPVPAAALNSGSDIQTPDIAAVPPACEHMTQAVPRSGTDLLMDGTDDGSNVAVSAAVAAAI